MGGYRIKRLFCYDCNKRSRVIDNKPVCARCGSKNCAVYSVWETYEEKQKRQNRKQIVRAVVKCTAMISIMLGVGIWSYFSPDELFEKGLIGFALFSFVVGVLS